MRKKQIVFCDSNIVYAERLQEYVTEEKTLPCQSDFYTDWKRCREFLSKAKVTACIVSEDLEKYFKEDKEIRESAEHWLLLCEEKEDENDTSIFRYQSVDALLRQIGDAIGIKGRTAANQTAGGIAKLIGVYTPVGRCLQTSFSLVLGQMLASRYKVLYLNFEAYSGFTQMMQQNFNADMADLLFFLKNLSKDFSQQFSGMKQNINGLDYIPPAFSYMDISSILPNEWEHFLTTLGELGEYDYIILDLTDYVQGLYQILRNCSYVYTITRNEGRALAKIAHYEEVLKELSYEDILEKTRKCSFPIYRQLPAEPEDLLYSELADYARKILREDFDFT
ncbi:MAG: hypothetical protein IJ397_09310 [Lachnospiraceae bacterium]|nr:hypothetical protein [Lachnospiraceae bacterium]